MVNCHYYNNRYFLGVKNSFKFVLSTSIGTTSVLISSNLTLLYAKVLGHLDTKRNFTRKKVRTYHFFTFRHLIEKPQTVTVPRIEN